MATLVFRKSTPEDAQEIWRILQQAINRRKIEGSDQWQDGYPNLETVNTDQQLGYGFVLEAENGIAAYSAIIKNDEPDYEEIDGEWLSNGDFFVVHRVAVSDQHAGKGIATKIFQEIENYAMDQKIPSIKVDTNYDNAAMLRILDKLGYQYCGKVMMRGGERLAFEKLLNI